MLSRETIDACLKAAAAELEAMSYDELESFAESHAMFDDWQSRKLEHNSAAVEVFMQAGKVGRIRKRICIEITLSTVGGEVPERTYGRYFERYKSGRFYPSPREAAREPMLAKVYLCVIVGGGLISLGALAWYLLTQ